MALAAKTLLSVVLTLVCINSSIWAGDTVPCTADHARTGGPTGALGLYKPGTPIPLAEGFRDPPAISRLQCWWQPPGSPFTKEEITRELEAFKDKGMGGVTIKDTSEMPRDEHTAHLQDIPFLSEPWLEMFAHIVRDCQRLGLICTCENSPSACVRDSADSRRRRLTVSTATDSNSASPPGRPACPASSRSVAATIPFLISRFWPAMTWETRARGSSTIFA